jgi:hypothetical protein
MAALVTECFMLKIPTILAVAMLASACASSPTDQAAGAPAAAHPPPAVVASVPVAPAPATSGAAAVPAKRVMSGFTLVMKNGVATYCRQDLKTGSHIVVQQRCLSQREYDSLEDDARRDFDRVRNTMSPTMGTSGGSAH